MNQNFKRFLRLLWQSIFFWTFAMFFYSVFRFFGMDQELAYSVNENFEGIQNPLQLHYIFCSIGFGLGTIYAIVDFLFEKYISKKISLGINILIKTFLYFVATVFIVTAVARTGSQILKIDFDLKLGWWIQDKRFWSAMFFVIVSSLVFIFIKIAAERFGKGLFLKILVGTYKNPKEEKRIFMFLDLKDSTTIAEALGHHKYSQFIQDCFNDLNEVVLNFEAGIYQYVGDEAVLSWPYEKGLKNNNCVELFFVFQQQLQSRNKYYLQTYGICPEFKAGLHGGAIMVAEVGYIKKELAYHGDVINTAARIQGECNKNNVSILISEKLLSGLNFSNKFLSSFLGNVILKGKEQEVNIHTITQNI